MTTDEAVIPMGTAVLSFNFWTSNMNTIVGECFRAATIDEVRALRVGDVVWIEIDPIHPGGMACGFVKVVITSNKDGLLEFKGGTYFGHGQYTRETYFVPNEDSLKRMIASHPEITDVMGSVERDAAARLKEQQS